MPVSRSRYSKIGYDVREASILQAQTSMEQARREVRDLYSIGTGTGAVADILVSCDGTWQKRGFTSLHGACFVIAYETALSSPSTALGVGSGKERTRPAWNI